MHCTCETCCKAFDHHEEGLECNGDVKIKMPLSHEQGKVLFKLNLHAEAFKHYEKFMLLENADMKQLVPGFYMSFYGLIYPFFASIHD